MKRDRVVLTRELRRRCGFAAFVCAFAPLLRADAASIGWWLAALLSWVASAFFLVAWGTERYPWLVFRSRARERNHKRREKTRR